MLNNYTITYAHNQCYIKLHVGKLRQYMYREIHTVAKIMPAISEMTNLPNNCRGRIRTLDLLIQSQLCYRCTTRHQQSQIIPPHFGSVKDRHARLILLRHSSIG